MSVETAIARIAELQTALAPRPAPTPVARQLTGTGSTQLEFQNLLRAAGASAPATTMPLAPVTAPGALGASGGSVGQRIVAAAQAEVGQAEQPPGSNDSPRIAQYRQATAGAPGPGPWCAYFASWAARQGGAPLGEQGQGFGSVDAVYAWAQRSGRALPVGGAVKPQPGDLVVWDEHIGVVESVLPDGRITTIEGNSSDQVARRTYGADGGGAVGFVHLG